MKSFTNLQFESLGIQFPLDYDALVPDGVWKGDPMPASVQVGREVMRSLVLSIARFIATCERETGRYVRLLDGCSYANAVVDIRFFPGCM